MPLLEDVSRKGMRTFGTTLIRFGAVGLAVPDPIPFVDEILFGAMIATGAGLVAYSEWGPMPYGAPTSLPMQSHPVTSTSGHTKPRGNGKKQMSSTSHSYYSRRKKYEYGKKRRY